MIHPNVPMPIDRRTLLAGIAATSVVASVTSAAAQTATDAATKVWLDMDQKALDDAYDQPKYAPNIQQVIKRYASVSDAMRTRVSNPKRAAYGPTEIQKLDIFSPKQAKAPIHIHIHGGAWRQRPASDYAFPGEMLMHAGAHYVVPDFISVDESNGELAPMVEQVRRAIAWTVSNAASFGGDPTRVYLSGFSSGAHLAGVALLTDWRKDYDLPDDVIKGAVLSSGLYDLKAVRLSARSKYVKFTDEVELAFSTQRHLARIRTPLFLAHGSYESPEFQRQTRDFAAALKAAGKPVQYVVNPNFNHFEMMETFGNPYGLLGRAVLEQMQLRSI
ncbi:alpha/beta hydrolase [Tardiphaga sp. vice278]|uniref:alpha/beta hydrolase n=1 Tax=Tardiphaga sp. vice278 TaxID=2592815 RepID=UPI00143DF17E|nr:alpha/beta hydrolase [Tardiphaga sp. vice278]